MCHRGLTVHRATTGADDLTFNLKSQQYLLFNPAQGQIAVLVNDLLQRSPGLLLYQQIGIDKPQAQAFCHQHPDGAFAAARHADKHQISAPGGHADSRASAERQAAAVNRTSVDEFNAVSVES